MEIRRIINPRTVPRSPGKVKCTAATLAENSRIGTLPVLFTAADALYVGD